jgi:hypothetical protein
MLYARAKLDLISVGVHHWAGEIQMENPNLIDVKQKPVQIRKTVANKSRRNSRTTISMAGGLHQTWRKVKDRYKIKGSKRNYKLKVNDYR